MASVGIVAALAPSAARGAERIPARVQVDAPEGCASRASFSAALARRTDRLEVSEAGGASIDVTIRRTDGQATGELRIARGGPPSAPRRVSAASCEEVAEGLALVAALAFDPAAKIDVAPVAAPAPEPAAEPAADPVAAPAEAAVAPGPVAAMAPAARERPTRSQPQAARTRVALAATGAAVALGAGATFGWGGFVGLERERGLWSPAARVGVQRAEASQAASAVGADLAWTLARASFCPVRFALAPGVSARPCAGLDAGVLSASARGVDRARDRSRPWIAPSAAVRLAWAPSDALFLEASGVLAAPLVRDEVVVDPAVSLYRAPVVAPAGEIAAGVHFP